MAVCMVSRESRDNETKKKTRFRTFLKTPVILIFSFEDRSIVQHATC